MHSCYVQSKHHSNFDGVRALAHFTEGCECAVELDRMKNTLQRVVLSALDLKFFVSSPIHKISSTLCIENENEKRESNNNLTKCG